MISDLNIVQKKWILINLYTCFTFMLFGACSDRAEPQKGVFVNKNVILISVDTLRSDYLGAYGSNKVETPNLDRLANESVLFTDAVTPVPLTLPAHTSLLTGLHPAQHQVRDNFQFGLSDAAVTIAELFQESDYATAGVIGAIMLSRRSGLGQGFDFYEDQFSMEEFLAVQPMVERRAERVTQIAEEWLEEHVKIQPEKPFFLFMHLYDPHMLYLPPSPFLEEYEDRPYAGEVAYVDYSLGGFLDTLREKGLYDETLILFVSDHGEGLGDHGEQTHGLFLYEEAVHVPFMMKLPESAGVPAKRTAQNASLLDVVPTLIEACGLGPVPTAGRSLLPWLLTEREIEPRDLVLETMYPLTYQWSPLFALRNPEWKFVQAPKAELYSLTADPGEMKNLIAVETDRAQALQDRLEDQLVNLASSSHLSSDPFVSLDRSEALAALGYAAPLVSSVTETDTLPDPKDRLEVYLLVDTGLAAAAMKDYLKAIELFQSAAEKDPQNPTPYFNLGQVYMKLGDWNRSLFYTDEALERAPESMLIHLQYARVLSGKGDLARARERLYAILKENPRLAEAHYQLGWLEMNAKRGEQAREHFLDAKEWMPDLPGIDAAIEQAERMTR